MRIWPLYQLQHGTGAVCAAAAEGREVTAHPVGFTWSDPAGMLYLGGPAVLTCAEGNDPKAVACTRLSRA